MRLKILEEVGWGREKQASVCRQKCFLSRVDDCFGFEGFFFEIVAKSTRSHVKYDDVRRST